MGQSPEKLLGRLFEVGRLKITFLWWGWALIRGWALINFFYLQGGRLFEVSAYSRLGAKSNKYGTQLAEDTFVSLSLATDSVA